MAVIVEDGKLRLSGYVGDYYFDDGFTAAEVVVALAEFDEDAEIDVHLNSPGGIATEGAAIHALLRERTGTTNIVVEGIAASAASLIAMAGTAVTMSAGSIMMIHDPSGFTFGTSAEHEKTVEQLEALATAYARVYAAKSGKSAEDCRAIMKRETWLTPEQAVAEGFADATTEEKAAPVAAFDYRVFAHAPAPLVALAKRKKWAFEARQEAAPPAPPRQQQETSMTDKAGGDDAAELKRLREENAQMKAKEQDRERRDAIMALPEAKGREKQAEALADAGVTAEAAKKILAAAPAPASEEEEPENPEPTAYERSRATAAGLNGGKPPAGKGDKSVLAAAVARTNKRF